MAEEQGVRSKDLHDNGIVDRVVLESPDAADEPEAFCRRMGQVLQHELVELMRADPADRRAARLARYRRLGL
jgi:acetyl-CoA carboxylase carboxyl transferase subunit beta